MKNTPGAFKIERWVNEPYEANVYIASAPIKTRDHLALLEGLEELG